MYSKGVIKPFSWMAMWLGTVAHYIHLNPVRAGIVECQQLQTYLDSSFHQLWYPRRRWGFGKHDFFLDAAGGLKDTSQGRKLYRNYLDWLSCDETEQKRLDFERMSKGWVKGTQEFKKAFVWDMEPLLQRMRIEVKRKTTI